MGTVYFATVDIGNRKDNTIHFLNLADTCEYAVVEHYENFKNILSGSGIEFKGQILSYEFNINGDGLIDNINNKVEALVKDGKDVLVVSDEGYSVLSDPFIKLLNLCKKNKMSYKILPGPSSVIQSAVHSDALGDSTFSFLGIMCPSVGLDSFNDNLNKIQKLYISQTGIPIIIFLNSETAAYTIKSIIQKIGITCGTLCYNLTTKDIIINCKLDEMILKVEEIVSSDTDAALTLTIGDNQCMNIV